MIMVRRASGFTLVAVMVALVVFLVASMGLLPLLLTHMQANRELKLHATARRLASEVMAELQVVAYGRLDTLAEVPLREDGIEIRQGVDTTGLPNGQSRITVTAHWQLRDRPQRYQLQTIRSAP